MGRSERRSNTKDEEPRSERAYRQAGTIAQIVAMILFLCFVFIRSSGENLWIGLVVWISMAGLFIVMHLVRRRGDLRRPSRRT